MTDGQYTTYEELHGGRVARIYLNRPEARNAQNFGLLGEVHEAFLRGEADDDVRVVILGGLGPAFSAGHDLGTPEFGVSGERRPLQPAERMSSGLPV